MKSRASVLNLSRGFSPEVERLYTRTKRRANVAIPVVAVDTEGGDLLIVHRSDLLSLARNYGALSEFLGPL